jgi:hypothetical protein
MNILKKNQYVILLMLTILFVSLSFSFILNIPLREGLTCLPICEKVTFDNTTGSIPECKQYKDQLLKAEDAKTMVTQCVNPFITEINSIMKSKYDYDTVIYKPLYVKKPYILSQKELNAYFTDPSCITIQDIMDKLYDNMNKIQKNDAAQGKDITKIVNRLIAYKADRDLPSPDIKQKYENFVSCVEKYMESVSARCEKYYVDENMNLLLKEVKETPSYYGISSSFRKLYEYITNAANGELAPKD